MGTAAYLEINDEKRESHYQYRPNSCLVSPRLCCLIQGQLPKHNVYVTLLAQYVPTIFVKLCVLLADFPIQPSITELFTGSTRFFLSTMLNKNICKNSCGEDGLHSLANPRIRFTFYTHTTLSLFLTQALNFMHHTLQALYLVGLSERSDHYECIKFQIYSNGNAFCKRKSPVCSQNLNMHCTVDSVCEMVMQSSIQLSILIIFD